MSLSLTKHANCIVKNARMLTTSIRPASGGWGRSYINVSDNIMQTYCIYINFGVPKNYSGKINVTFCKDVPKLPPSILTETLTSVRTCSKKEELEIVKCAPISYYTYS
jgi:hypothetical protein